VNVIAPIMTEPDGISWRQTTFFPFAISSRLATGKALRLRLDSPTYVTEQFGEVPLIDAAASFDAEEGTAAIFLVNRSQTETLSVSLGLRDLEGLSLISAESLFDSDIHAANTLSAPERVGMQQNTSAKLVEGVLKIDLPPVSWTAVALG